LCLTGVCEFRSFLTIMCENQTPFLQADHLIDKVGVARLCEITGRHAVRVRQWRRGKSVGGTDGLVPAECLAAIFLANAEPGSDLRLETADFLPRPRAELDASELLLSIQQRRRGVS